MAQKQWECWRKTPLNARDKEAEEKVFRWRKRFFTRIDIRQRGRLKAFWRNNTF